MAKFTKISNDIKNRNRFNEVLHRTLSLNLYLIKPKKRIKKKEIRDSFPIIRNKNRCFITGSARSINTQFALSRHSFRKYLNRGFFPATGQSSW